MGREALRVFLSHTSELRKHPKAKSFVDAAEEALLAAEATVLDMKHMAARDQEPAAYCQEKLKAADVYVGIIGFRYGTPVPGSDPVQSYTQLEFKTATTLKLTRLVFLLDGESDEPLPLPREFLSDPAYENQQSEFRRQLLNQGAITAERVLSPDELKAKLTQALSQRSGSASDTAAAEDHSEVGSRPTWPTLAGAAQQKVQKVLQLLQDATRAIEQVEHGYEEPARMDAWDNWDDKDRKHRELAASVIEPATNLQACLQQTSENAEEARKNIGELCAKRFAARTDRPQSIIHVVSEILGFSARLAKRVTQARDELEERVEDYPDYYQIPYSILVKTYELAEQVTISAMRMEREIDRPLAAESGHRQAVPWGETLAGPQSSSPTPSAPPGIREAEVTYIDVGGKAAAGPRIVGAGTDSDPQPVPSDLVRGRRVVAVKVQGTSMEEDDIRDGDYVIIDRDLAWKDKDIVVIRVDGRGDAQTSEALVKRIRLRPDGTLIHLESSDRKLRPEIIRPEDNPVVEGKVIGVFRSLPR
jgi:SOS-response transcriptional repressor LexA